MIRYKCRKCGVPMESPEDSAGKMEICPGCGHNIRVPFLEGHHADRRHHAGEGRKACEFDVAVTTKEGKEMIATRNRAGEAVYLVPDPKNRDNPYIVGVYLARGSRRVEVGRVPDDQTREVARRLLTGWHYHATVDRVINSGGFLGLGKKHALRVNTTLSPPGSD